MTRITKPAEFEGKIAGKIVDLLNDGYSIFTGTFSDGDEYHVTKRIDARTTTTFCHISPEVKKMLLGMGAKIGEKTQYFGKRQIIVTGMNVEIFSRHPQNYIK